MAISHVRTESEDESTGGQTQSLSITTPAANDLLIYTWGSDDAGTMDTGTVKDQNGDSFTLLQFDTSGVANNAFGGMWYKVADGDETSIVIDFSGTETAAGESVCSQYTGINSGDALDGSNEDTANIATTVTTQSSGSYSASVSDGLAYFMCAVGSTNRWDSSDSVASSVGTIRNSLSRSTVRGGLVVSDLVFSTSGSKSTSFTTGSGGSGCYGVVGVFKAAGGGAVTVSPDDVSQSQSIDNVTLTQANVLAVDDLTQGQSIDGVTLTQANILAVADIDQGQSLDSVTLTQAHVIAVNDLDQGQTLDNVTLTAAGSLAVAGITQAQLIDLVSLTQAHILAVDGIGQGQSIDNVTLAVAGSLAVQAVTQGQSLDGVTLTQQGVLSVDDLTQAQLLEAATLTQHYQLAVQDLLQGQLLDNVTLSAGSLSIAPDDLSQGQDIDQVSLTEYAVLAVNDLTQSQIIDIVSLGGLVIGELEGKLVVYALLDGDIVAKTLLTGSITLH